mmetsp:Transcript_12714/g.35542  ORF Transcript_12714/g.35542 Transcript_12714/m.35542 type:complete len:222 (+) Transcript_12714:514-1179(+)
MYTPPPPPPPPYARSGFLRSEPLLVQVQDPHRVLGKPDGVESGHSDPDGHPAEPELPRGLEDEQEDRDVQHRQEGAVVVVLVREDEAVADAVDAGEPDRHPDDGGREPNLGPDDRVRGEQGGDAAHPPSEQAHRGAAHERGNREELHRPHEVSVLLLAPALQGPDGRQEGLGALREGLRREVPDHEDGDRHLVAGRGHRPIRPREHRHGHKVEHDAAVPDR